MFIIEGPIVDGLNILDRMWPHSNYVPATDRRNVASPNVRAPNVYLRWFLQKWTTHTRKMRLISRVEGRVGCLELFPSKFWLGCGWSWKNDVHYWDRSRRSLPWRAWMLFRRWLALNCEPLGLGAGGWPLSRLFYYLLLHFLRMWIFNKVPTLQYQKSFQRYKDDEWMATAVPTVP